MENERDKQNLVSSFLEIAIGQTTATAEHYLQSTSWNLEEAIQLFYVGNEGSRVFPASSALPLENIIPTGWDDDVSGESVHPSLPPRRDDAAVGPTQNLDGSVWESDSRTASRDTILASLFRPPLGLMFHGDFHSAKIKAAMDDKWLLLNLQSTKEFSSHMLNRDTWSNGAVEQTIRSRFIFWQTDQETDQGLKVCSYYELVSLPAILVIDPITGQKMHQWSGMVQPEPLLEGLLPYMESRPKNHDALPYKHLRELSICDNSRDDHTSTAGDDDESTDDKDSQSGSNRKHVYLPLPEEPKEDGRLLCRIKIRLPGGQRIQRAFLRTDQIKLLWSFCCNQLDEGESQHPFYFTLAIPGASRRLEYESNQTFEDSQLSNSMVTLVWI